MGRIYVSRSPSRDRTTDFALCVFPVPGEKLEAVSWCPHDRIKELSSRWLTMSESRSKTTLDEPINIFLVEDNPGDVRLVEEAFKMTDHEITLNVVTDGDTAVRELVEAEPDGSSPDLVLLDLNLPGQDGCAVLDAIRKDSDIKSLPVLILSSSSADDDIARCYDAEANAYLTKPGNLAELTSMMKTVEDFWFERVQLPPTLV